MTRDLTEKKRSEDKMKEYVQELQQQNEELDRFAYAASHDLQEPVRKVQTYADLIEQSIDDKPAVRRYVEKILTSADRMQALIKSVLEYSYLSKDVMEKVETDLNQVLTGVISDFEVLIHDKQAVVNKDQLPVIKAIPPQINQLFTNLLSNALKFSDKHPLITISSAIVQNPGVGFWPEHLAHGSYHQLAFSDNGIGFEPQFAAQIFSLFQRLHRKDEYNGTGIGLALCKKIMDNHEGFIYAKGNPGNGATICMYFPIK